MSYHCEKQGNIEDIFKGTGMDHAVGWNTVHDGIFDHPSAVCLCVGTGGGNRGCPAGAGSRTGAAALHPVSRVVQKNGTGMCVICCVCGMHSNPSDHGTKDDRSEDWSETTLHRHQYVYWLPAVWDCRFFAGTDGGADRKRGGAGNRLSPALTTSRLHFKEKAIIIALLWQSCKGKACDDRSFTK